MTTLDASTVRSTPGTTSATDRGERSTPAPLGADLRLALPTGRMLDSLLELFTEAGLRPDRGGRGYRLRLRGLPETDAKLLKPRQVVEMLASGRRDVGFAGLDWIREDDADVVDVLDTGLDGVRMVLALPTNGSSLEARCATDPPLRLASAYPRTARRLAETLPGEVEIVRAFGAVEALPPDDADAIVDLVQTGATLAANGLVVDRVLFASSTRLVASRAAWEDPARRTAIERLALLLRSVLDARERVMLELNCEEARVAEVVDVLPAMRRPTIASLAGGGVAVKAVVPRAELASLMLQLRAAGAGDLVVTEIRQVLA